MKMLTLAASLSVALCIAWASPASAAIVYSTIDDLDWVYPGNSGLRLRFKNYSHPLGTCGSGQRFIIKTDHPNYDVLVSTVLMGFASERPLRVYFDDSQPAACDPVVDAVMVQD